MRHAQWVAAAMLCAAAGTASVASEHGPLRELPEPDADAVDTDRAELDRGRYLARVGNCAGCHTAPGGRAFAGGRRLLSEFGVFHTPNITPDDATGIGTWSDDDLWNALHHGERADGAALYPACPYPSFTLVTRKDVDAIYAYLRSLPAVQQDNPAHELGFPYGMRSLVPVWQTLYFTPGRQQAALAEPDDQRSADWRRGRYLVEGLGHCNDCHRERGRLGALSDAAAAPGAMIHDRYAPALSVPHEAGLQAHSVESAAAFLRSGKSERAVMMGPMADVVFDSLRHLTPADARAMAAYLTSVEEREVEASTRLVGLSEARTGEAMERGRAIYERQCADCHGRDGQGRAGVSALAGNPTVTMSNPANLINVIRQGGFPASTRGNPRPHGMPPFQQLDYRDLAAVATYIRRSWGNDAPGLSSIDLRE